MLDREEGCLRMGVAAGSVVPLQGLSDAKC